MQSSIGDVMKELNLEMTVTLHPLQNHHHHFQHPYREPLVVLHQPLVSLPITYLISLSAGGITYTLG